MERGATGWYSFSVDLGSTTSPYDSMIYALTRARPNI
jgi:hypothetical protein